MTAAHPQDFAAALWVDTEQRPATVRIQDGRPHGGNPMVLSLDNWSIFHGPRLARFHDEPFSHTLQGGIECDESKMELRRPYPFEVAGVWFVAVKYSGDDGDVRLYQLP